MKKMSETIVFFGSGPVAAASLELLAEDFIIEVVITKPQPPHHKDPFPVLELCKRLSLKTFCPADKASISELFATAPTTSRLGVVIDYGFIINQDVIDYFPLGIINSHFSLLPRWRGADPISFAILGGDAETGVSLMMIVKKMDEGPLLAQSDLIKITSETTTPSLTQELIKLSHNSLKSVIPQYVSGKVIPEGQDNTVDPTYSRKLTKADGIIDWQKPAIQIEREIRAYLEWPKSKTVLAGKDVIITSAEASNIEVEKGKITVVNDQLLIGCSEGSLRIKKLKPAGKNEMPSSAFIAGYGDHT